MHSDRLKYEANKSQREWLSGNTDEKMADINTHMSKCEDSRLMTLWEIGEKMG